jgi:uncharacterized protein (DUF433 family)
MWGAGRQPPILPPHFSGQSGKIRPLKAPGCQSNKAKRPMTTLVSERTDEPWRRRLYLPAYQVGEAARYAQISAQTVVAWHKLEKATLTQREKRAALTYYQLIEVAVVAAFRKAGVSLKRIRAAREYVAHILRSDHPFAEYRFKEEARHLWLDAEQIDLEPGTVLQADQEGQLAWDTVIGRLREFEYEHDEGIVLKWHVAGIGKPIIIDPRIAFGTPTVSGTPTWVIKGRWDAGESDSDIADDFQIKKEEVREALKFEGVMQGGRRELRVH